MNSTVSAQLRRRVQERAKECWAEHFEIEGALLLGRTETGRATIALLQLNRSERVAERKLLLASGLIP